MWPTMTAAQLRALSRARALAESGQARLIREGARVSLSELARSIRVDVSTLSRWERGERVPRSLRALEWAKAVEGLEAEMAARWRR